MLLNIIICNQVFYQGMKKIGAEEKAELQKLAGGKALKELTGDLVQAIDPDRHVEQAKKDNPGVADPTPEQIKKAATKIIQASVKPLHTPELRKRLVELHKTMEQTIDTVSIDEVTASGFSAEALENAKKTVTSFEQFIKNHKDEITALQILYSRPYKARLRFEEIKALAQIIEKPPYLWKIDRLWDAYAALEKSKVKGASAPHILTDLVSLVRFAIHQYNELVPFPEKVNVNFNAWIAQQENVGKKFTAEQRRWLEMIRDHIAANLSIDANDFDYAPFAQQGGLGKVHQVFGDELNKIIEELNGVLAA